jgi:hypothetical protein
MATRTSYVGTESTGDTLTTTNFDKLPGGWIGSAQATSDQGSVTTEVDVTSCSVTVTAGTSRRLRISGHIRIQSDVADDRAILQIYRGATQIQGATVTMLRTNTTESIEVFVDDTPSSGSNTYKLTVQRGSGSGTLTVKASSVSPSIIMVEDVGPAS